MSGNLALVPEEAMRIARQSCPGANDDELRELLGSFQGVRNLAALITAFARDGRLAQEFEAVRERRRKAEIGAALDQLRGKAPCPHGVDGGTEPHPASGKPVCPNCRAAANGQDHTAVVVVDSAAAVSTAGDAGPAAAVSESRRLVLTSASCIKPRPVLWGWDERMPAGHVSLVAGREGIGKSLFVISLAAEVTCGALAGLFRGSPRPVFYCATEDSWQHTIIPRLIAAGADLDLVYRIEVETVEASAGTGMVVELSLPRDCQLLAAEIERLGVAMVVLDPLMSAIDRAVDTYNDREMRTVLEPLSRLADETGCMIVGIAHFNKSADADPLNLVTGSRAFTAVVRAVIAVARDPDADDGGCVVSQVKNNLGRFDLPNLTYVIRTAVIETDEGNAHTGQIHFTGESDRSVRDILADLTNVSERTARAECAEWLREVLAEPRRSKELTDEAKAHGHAPRTLARARKQLGVRTEQLPAGPQGQNEWWASLS